MMEFIPPLHPDGRKFVAIFAAVTLVLFFLWVPLGWLGVILTLWCAWFFRDPARVTPIKPGLVVSPADGLITSIVEVLPPKELQLPDVTMRRISVFLSIFDVHVNRIPAAGTIVSTYYREGTFVNASLDKASEDNERMSVRLKTAAGPEIGVVQIAGLIARRIVCQVTQGQAVTAGERFGLIRFGSRVDVYLPLDWSVLAIEGQRAVAGETVLADAGSTEPARNGIKR
jgi:phosphatidylserine decarboxylase